MANWVGDLSVAYGCTATLFATSTGVSASANAQGSSVDLSSNIGNIVSATLVVGNAAGTTPTLDVFLQESTDGSNNWTTLSGSAFTQVTTSNQVQVLGVKPTKRYVRSSGTTGGTNPVFETTVLLTYPLSHAPANDGGWDQVAASAN